ncbi:MAG TPA: YceI family protein [Candidatus Acidoferrales bacterium]|nr:YceI family protein [Candidatus Acidoferrales bacterium]
MATQAQAVTVYNIDPAHTTVEFVVRHLMITKVRGRFTKHAGTLTLAPGSDVPAALAVTIDAASIDTREEQRDAHLRSGDFFEVEKHPHLTFESTSISGSPDSFTVTGKLTLHGVTRDVTLAGAFEGRAKDPWGGERVGYTAQGTINRKDFGLNWNAALETGGAVVGDEVKIELNVEAVKAQ